MKANEVDEHQKLFVLKRADKGTDRDNEKKIRLGRSVMIVY